MERIGAFMVRHPWLVTIPLVLMATLAVGVGVYNYLTAQRLDERVTIIERSPCAEAPGGQECQMIFRESIRNFTPSTTCVLERKLNLPCGSRFRP